MTFHDTPSSHFCVILTQPDILNISSIYNMIHKKFTQTRMHSSRMCTVRMLTVSQHALCRGSVSQHLPGRGVCIPACTGQGAGVYPSLHWAGGVCPGGYLPGGCLPGRFGTEDPQRKWQRGWSTSFSFKIYKRYQ